MQEIGREQLKAKMERGDAMTVVEVLGRDDYRRFHLPRAIHVPLGPAFDEAIQEAVPDKERPVVLYCSNVECHASHAAAHRMEDLGYRNVLHYPGGKEEWAAAAMPIER